MGKGKKERTVADKGKKKLTTVEEEKENSSPVVQVLRKRNTGVVIRDEDERKVEAMPTEKQKGTVVDKGKKKITTAEKEKENSCPAGLAILRKHMKTWLDTPLEIFRRPNKKALLIIIMVAILYIYEWVDIIENYPGVVLQGGDQDSIPFSTSDATNSTYTSFIEALRARLTNGVPDVFGIPMLPQSSSVPDSRRFFLVDLSNYAGNTITVAIDVVNVYVVAFRVRDQAYFFRDAPKAAFTTLFTETVNPRTLNCSGNYIDLKRRHRSQSREQTDLGIDALDQAISNLWHDVDAALGSSFLLIIQMVAEAVRFRPIERRVRQSITRGNSFRPDPRMLSLQNSWSSLSTEIQSSPDGVKFNQPVILQSSDYNHLKVANGLSPVIAGLALLLNRCPARPQRDTAPARPQRDNAILALRVARTAFSILGDDGECDDWNLTEFLETMSSCLYVLWVLLGDDI